MIEIKESPNGGSLIISAVTDFCDSMGYCEFKIKHFLKGIKPPQTKITIAGTKAHEEQEQFEREHFEFAPISKEELEDITKDVEYPYESIYTRFLAPLKFNNEKLSVLIFGRADKVYRSKETLIVEDTKFPWDEGKYLETYEPYPDQKLQTLLYLNSLFTETGSFKPEDWFKIPHKEKGWVINIKNRDTNESIRTFRGIQTKEAEDFLQEKLNKFALIVMGILEPEHHQSVKKCKSCRFEDCEYKLS